MQKKTMNKPTTVITEPSEESRKKHVLVAILGTSPAVLTEAVWALAMQKNIVLDKIVVLTTTEGRDKFFKDVYDKKIWKRFCSDLKAAGKPIDKVKIGRADFKIFPDENNNFADDLLSYDANMLAADMIAEELGRFNKGDTWIIHGLIAGGRKTMTALFFSCMCLLARKGDQVYHVLAPGCENDPNFYYPRTPLEANKVNLFSVPFVRMGRWAEDMTKNKGMTYRNLIDAVEHELDTALNKKREGAGGRSSLQDGKVTEVFGIADDGRTIRADSESFKITSKKMWEVIDKLLKVAKRKGKNNWAQSNGDEIKLFRGTTDAKRFRRRWIETGNAPGCKRIDKARLRTSPQDK